MGLTILPSFDPGGDIGKSLGSGLGRQLEIEADRQRLRRGLADAREQINKPGANYFDALLAMIEGTAGVAGGPQMVADIAPTIRQELLSRAAIGEAEQDLRNVLATPPPRFGEEGGQIGAQRRPGDAPKMSVEEEAARERLRRLKGGQFYQEAEESALRGQELQQKKQAQRFQQQTQAQTFFDTNISGEFEKGLSAPVLRHFNNRYEQAIAGGETSAGAFERLLPEMRLAQKEDESFQEAIKRPGFLRSVPEDYYERLRRQFPRLINMDPEYVRGELQREGFYGPSEAAQVTHPPDKNMKALRKTLPKYYGKPREGRPGFDANVVNPATEKQLRDFFKNRFDPETQSLLVVKDIAYSKGIPEELLLQVVEEEFPGGEGLSDINRRELQELREPYVESIRTIFDTWFGDDGTKAIEMLERNIKTGLGKRR